MSKNTILSSYQDKTRQMLAIKKPTTDEVEIIHRTLFPTQSNKFTTISLNEEQLDVIVNNTLAKPYNINLGLNNLIVSETNMQFIINTDISYISIDIQLTSKIMSFFKDTLDKLIDINSYSNNLSCNHKKEGEPNVDVKGNVATCKDCGESFVILDKVDIPSVEVASDTLRDAINTIKLVDSTLTRSDLLTYAQILSDIESIPTILEDSLNKLDTF